MSPTVSILTAAPAWLSCSTSTLPFSAAQEKMHVNVPTKASLPCQPDFWLGHGRRSTTMTLAAMILRPAATCRQSAEAPARRGGHTGPPLHPDGDQTQD